MPKIRRAVAYFRMRGGIYRTKNRAPQNCPKNLKSCITYTTEKSRTNQKKTSTGVTEGTWMTVTWRVTLKSELWKSRGPSEDPGTCGCFEEDKTPQLRMHACGLSMSPYKIWFIDNKIDRHDRCDIIPWLMVQRSSQTKSVVIANKKLRCRPVILMK